MSQAENEMRLAEIMIQESRKFMIERDLTRIHSCLGKLSDEEIWHRPNDESVSIGNLILHLSGNVRQYIISGIGGAPDVRKRQREFDETGPISREQLRKTIDATMREADEVLGALDPADMLRPRKVQCYEETPFTILFHVVEHFSYHVGQITRDVKRRKSVDMGYYAGQNLNETN